MRVAGYLLQFPNCSADLYPVSSKLSIGCVSAPDSLQDLEKEVTTEYERHGASLKRYLLGHGASAAKADDLIQDAFLKYYLLRLAGEKVENPRAWLFTVVRHGWLEVLRSPRYQREVELAPAVATGVEPDDGMWRSLWALAVGSLAPREKQCMELRRDGLQYDEIAEVMGVQPGTVAALIARAQTKIRRNLAESMS